MRNIKNQNTAYVVGLAIGDGNLSSSNNRTIRLRITCDDKYPRLRERIVIALQKQFIKNKVSIYKRAENCSDVYCYSNSLETILGWKAKGGSKYQQNVRIPDWIFLKKLYVKKCLKGLFETDGSVYKDRDYTYINFTTIIKPLKDDILRMIEMLGFKCTTSTNLQKSGKIKYVLRVCKRSQDFIREINVKKE